jgi:5-methylcytosine-specific restriction endonuclease McrA
MDGWNGLNADFDIGLGSPLRPKNSKLIERDSRRKFTKLQSDEVYSKQKGKCAGCNKWLDPLHTHYDHIKPWALGGRTIVKNCQALCANCHSEKTKRETLNGIKGEGRKKPIRKQNPSNDIFMNPLGKSQKKKNSNDDSWLYP